MKITYFFILGLGILVGAITLNILASRVGLVSWFEFLKSPGQTSFWSYTWLFIGYPLGLGVIAYYVYQWLNF